MGNCASCSAKVPSEPLLKKTELNEENLGKAIKDCLDEGAKYAEDMTAGEGKFLNNENIKINLPDSINKTSEWLAKFGMDEQLKELEVVINRSAEKGCEGSAAVFMKVVAELSLGDATALLKDENKSAITEYLRKHSEESLEKLIRPEIERGLDESKCLEVWEKFKSTYSEAKEAANLSSGAAEALGGLISAVTGSDPLETPELEEVDFVQYVLDKCLAALFNFISEKEEALRENPAGAATELVTEAFTKFGAKNDSGAAKEEAGSASSAVQIPAETSKSP